MMKELHSSYTGKTPQNNRGNLAQKKRKKTPNIFHWASSKSTIMQQPLSIIEKSYGPAAEHGFVEILTS